MKIIIFFFLSTIFLGVVEMLIRVLLHGDHMDDDDQMSFLQSDSMVKMHASFELVAWALLLNFGSIFGRYMKNPPNDGELVQLFSII